MANLFLRFLSSFACVPVKRVGGRKREAVLAHIVGGVYFEGARIGFLLKCWQKTKKDEPEKTKKRQSSSFVFSGASFFFFNKKQIQIF